VGTNYYVDTPSCENACEHCSESERIHLGKSSAGWRFLFYAEPDWPREEAFSRWVRRALSGPITDEYRQPITLAEFLDMVAVRADGIDHVNRPPEREYGTADGHDFKSGGHDFRDREFS
jgi:hypothetical protein